MTQCQPEDVAQLLRTPLPLTEELRDDPQLSRLVYVRPFLSPPPFPLLLFSRIAADPAIGFSHAMHSLGDVVLLVEGRSSDFPNVRAPAAIENRSAAKARH